MIKNILEYFDETVKNKSEKVAVIDGEREITFLGLSQSAKALSIQLCQVCTNQIRRPIAVFMAKSIESVVSDLGIIYSGNAYMNLDVKTPLQRIKNILDLVDPLCIITDTAHQQALNTVWPAEKTLLINPDLSLLTAENEDALYENLEQLIDTDPLCLINTSGSTGTPKSVILNHKSFIDFTEWAISTTGIGENEIVGSLSPIVFDIYSFELCMLMANPVRLW